MSAQATKRKRTGRLASLPHKRYKRGGAAAYHSSSSEDDEPQSRRSISELTKSAGRPKSSKPQASDAPSSSPSEEEDVMLNLVEDGPVSTSKDVKKNALKAVEEEDDDSGLEQEDEFSLESDASEEQSDDDESDASEVTSQQARTKTKRNDPTAFATSISKILESKLTKSKRADPVLSRSKQALDVAKELTESKLEIKAKRKLRDDKKVAQDKGRVRDVLATADERISTALVVEQEKRLRKMAQRGVVKLFNAVRAAQVKAEEAMVDSKSKGTVGLDRRQERVNEMSKQGFLDLIAEGGK